MKAAVKDVEGRVIRTLADVLGLDPDHVTLETSPDSVPGWDSANMLQLILGLENEFDITFEAEDVADMLSVGLMVEIVREKLQSS